MSGRRVCSRVLHFNSESSLRGSVQVQQVPDGRPQEDGVGGSSNQARRRELQCQIQDRTFRYSQTVREKCFSASVSCSLHVTRQQICSDFYVYHWLWQANFKQPHTISQTKTMYDVRKELFKFVNLNSEQWTHHSAPLVLKISLGELWFPRCRRAMFSSDNMLPPYSLNTGDNILCRHDRSTIYLNWFVKFLRPICTFKLGNCIGAQLFTV